MKHLVTASTILVMIIMIATCSSGCKGKNYTNEMGENTEVAVAVAE